MQSELYIQFSIYCEGGFLAEVMRFLHIILSLVIVSMERPPGSKKIF